MKTLKRWVVVLFLALSIIGLMTAFGGQKKKAEPLDGDTVWKQQCSRCHLAPGAIPKKKMATVIRHMRTVTPLTEEEYKALIRFITK
ncbi:MAG: cytochrome c [Acidobacteriota bacterium]